MKNVIIKKKVREKEGLSEGIVDKIAPAEVARALSPVDLAWEYMWAMNNANINAAKKLGVTGIKKYWSHAGQGEIELDWLYDWISVLATFVKYSHRVYNNEEVTKYMNVRQDMNPE